MKINTYQGPNMALNILRGAFGKPCTFSHRILHCDQSKTMNASFLMSGHWAFGCTTSLKHRYGSDNC